MSSHLLEATIASVKSACRKQPSLHKQAAILIRDIAAVCMGLRGGIMVDYIPLTSSVMLSILADIQSQQNPAWNPATWPALSLLHLDGCLYLVRPDLLRAQAAQLCQSHASTTAFVTDATDDDQSLAVASADAVKAVIAQLQTLLRAVTRSEHAVQSSCFYVDLDVVEGLPIMPTLSGWLLQYPVVYLADCHSAEHLARLLSDSVLNLYEVRLMGAWVQELQSQFPNQAQLDCLYAFTVPERLLVECEQAIKGWQDQINRHIDEKHSQLEVICHRLPAHQVQL